MEAKPYPEEKRGILIEQNAKDFTAFLEEITDRTGKQFIREKLLESQVPGFRKGRAPLRTCLKKKKRTQEFMFPLNHWSSKILN